jgi:serine protease
MFKLLIALSLLVFPAPVEGQFETQWGLDRINQREHYLDGWNWMGEGHGEGITVYVVDSGVTADDYIFGDRLLSGFTVIGKSTESCGQNHGTSIASIIAGSGYGVAQSASIVSVRVLKCDGRGTAGNIIKGLKWIAANADPATSIVNMSLSGAADKRVDAAVNALVNLGIPVVVAAGNNSANACRYSPARAAQAITIGASNNLDMRSRMSNSGPCLSIYAPGEKITAWHPTLGEITPSGTSGAAAIFSGAIAAAATIGGVTTEEAAEIVLLNGTEGALCCGYKTTTSKLLYLGEDIFAEEEQPWHEDWWAW